MSLWKVLNLLTIWLVYFWGPVYVCIYFCNIYSLFRFYAYVNKKNYYIIYNWSDVSQFSNLLNVDWTLHEIDAWVEIPPQTWGGGGYIASLAPWQVWKSRWGNSDTFIIPSRFLGQFSGQGVGVSSYITNLSDKQASHKKKVLFFVTIWKVSPTFQILGGCISPGFLPMDRWYYTGDFIEVIF